MGIQHRVQVGMCTQQRFKSVCLFHVRTQRVRTGGLHAPPPPPPPPLKNHKNIGFLSNTGPDPLECYKATEPAFNVRLSSAHQRKAVLMALHWWADDGRLLVLFESSLHPHQLKSKKKKQCFQSWTLSDKTFWIHTCICSLIRLRRDIGPLTTHRASIKD